MFRFDRKAYSIYFRISSPHGQFIIRILQLVQNKKKLVMEGGFSELSSNNWGRAGSGKGSLGPVCLGFLGVAQGLMDM